MKPAEYEELRWLIQSEKDFGGAQELEYLVYYLNHFYPHDDSDVDVLLDLIGVESKEHLTSDNHA